MKKNVQSFLPHLLALGIFLVVTFLYFSPLLGGKTLSMHDINMASGGAKELQDYHEKTGEWAWWTNSMFGGMPAFMIAGGYGYSIASKIGAFFYEALPVPANVIFLLMAGFYLLMTSLKKNQWVAILASIAYAFGTYNLLFTEAGHLSKILALAYAPALMAGFVYIFRGRYLVGTFLTALFLGLELYANHLQITYYFIYVLAAYSIYETVRLLRQNKVKQLVTIALCLFASVVIGVGTNTMRLWNNLSYSAETTRGKSELTTSKAGSNGLDRDYAFGWSYGIDETFNLLVPNLMGGGSAGALSEDSETYKTLSAGGVEANMAKQFIQQLPLYHGDQSITSGPAYSGIIVIFLFILGLFVSKKRIKWVILGLTLLFIVLSWGSNFPAFNNLFYDIVPGYNKFRAVTMVLTIVHFLLVWGAANSVHELMETSIDWQAIQRNVIYALGTTLALMLVGYTLVDFVGANDETFKSSLAQSLGPDFAQRILDALRSDRASMATSDIFRGIILLLLSTGLLFFFKKGKLTTLTFGIAFTALVAFDMISVDKRYFNNDDFIPKRLAKTTTFVPTAANEQILKDTDPHFRVLNLTTSFWSDAQDSYFHKSIGGYHGAKLKKIQELYEYQMIKDGQLNLPILNMLNTKYLITNGQNNTPVAQQNPDALGNAWFIDSLNVVKNADEEMAVLTSFNPRKTAVTQASFKATSAVFTPDVTDKIQLTNYAPNTLVYSSVTQKPQFAVFSEIFYKGNKDWKSYIDGKEVPHSKVNYVLRGMEIPAGKHEIKFEFKPASVEKGKYGDLIASILLVGLLIGVVIFENKKTA